MEMDEKIFLDIFSNSEKQKRTIQQKKRKRFLFDKLSGISEKTKTIQGIVGLRGCGKTVILLQLAAELDNSIYVSSEQLLIRSISIYDFISYAKQKGFSNIFVDEVHLYPNWSLELKAAYDEGGLFIFFSGSSAMAIQDKGADLSRRARFHNLPPLSFREFLLLKYDVELPKISMEELLDYPRRRELVGVIGPHIGMMNEYMGSGALPFSLDEKNPQPLYVSVLSKMVRSDLASLKKININSVETVYQMLGLIATSNPDRINYNSMANALNKNIYVIMETIRMLNDVDLIMPILPEASGTSGARKEYKLLLRPPFRTVISNMLGKEANIGAIREEFFINNLGHQNIRYIKTERKGKTSDYRYKGHSFEIGGISKGRKSDTDFTVVDGLSLDEKKIPLALFGLFY
jgi:hypothetical protein